PPPGGCSGPTRGGTSGRLPPPGRGPVATPVASGTSAATSSPRSPPANGNAPGTPPSGPPTAALGGGPGPACTGSGAPCGPPPRPGTPHQVGRRRTPPRRTPPGPAPRPRWSRAAPGGRGSG